MVVTIAVGLLALLAVGLFVSAAFENLHANLFGGDHQRRQTLLLWGISALIVAVLVLAVSQDWIYVDQGDAPPEIQPSAQP